MAWQNRLVRQHRAADEARRQKIAELRRSGQIIEIRKSHDVPFGIRAVQSGIQIDGIWVSNTNAPLQVPLLSSPKLPPPRRTSSDFSSSIINAVSSIESSQSGAGASGRGRTQYRRSEPSAVSLQRSTGTEGSSQELQDLRTMHKPRNPSHLRFGGYGGMNHDEDTLGQLEGYPSSKEKILQKDGDIESSAMADNEQSSESSNNGSLSNHKTPAQNHYRQSLPPWPARGTSLLPSYGARSSFPQQSRNGEYFSIPLDPTDEDISPVFVTSKIPAYVPPLSNRTINTQDIADMTASAASEVAFLTDTPLPSRVPSPLMPSPFIPGALHMNRVSRKINSGFELLPAGTFGTPSPPRESKDKELEKDFRWSSDDGKRQTNKLQKKIRPSISSRRASASTTQPQP